MTYMISKAELGRMFKDTVKGELMKIMKIEKQGPQY